MFEDLGLKYVGPVDGHDIEAHGVGAAPGPGVRRAGHRARRHDQGLRLPAGRDRPDRRLARAPACSTRDSGRRSPRRGADWTDAFSEELVRIGAERADVVAITAAMLHPTGLDAFAERFPERTFDVGIAEQHALTSAAGLAMGGLHPVVVRLRDVPQPGLRPAAHGRRAAPAPVTFVLDRAGRHRHRRRLAQRHVGHVDPLGRARAAARRAARRATLREALREAVDVDRRADRRPVPQGRPAAGRAGAASGAAPVDVLRRGGAGRAAGGGRLDGADLPRRGRARRRPRHRA